MTDESSEDFVSTELAIQRELAYRRKVAMLNWPPNVDSGEQLMPLQVQSIRLSGRKQVAPDGNGECLPLKRLRSSDDHIIEHKPNSLFCNICLVPCSGPMNYEQHINSKKHQVKLQALRSGTKQVAAQVPCSGPMCYKQHINSKKHQVKLQGLRFGEENGVNEHKAGNGRRWCSLCKIWCMNDSLFEQHLAGQKHTKEQQKLQLARLDVVKIGKQQNWCELCGIGCTDESLLQMHFNGKKHQAELKKRKIGEVEDQQTRCALCNTWCPDESALRLHLAGKKHVLREFEVRNRQGSNAWL